jgi:hypothetical protein
MQQGLESSELGAVISNPFTEIGDECVKTERIMEVFTQQDQSELLLFFKHFRI